ncbi:hypothetical protein DOE78_07125 [Bacillus sp. Y1]|nr:hypothetical protein DOE78_07125 [Bacillus sp. Y1]
MTSFFKMKKNIKHLWNNLTEKNKSKYLKVKKGQSIIELQKVKVSQSQIYINRRKNVCFVKHVKKQKPLLL